MFRGAGSLREKPTELVGLVFSELELDPVLDPVLEPELVPDPELVLLPRRIVLLAESHTS
ncbi:hypothetical protein [Paenibacillus endoradicis]|uniref:hypothetical protein n=1 Tax=Paenibacillus endoradicis TaxID=2972487 RepID=UPI002158AE12|nr:hypothetical protein [Paenibacillus endoradicis]MCR8656874.1 hypothetical protein [Paenibacillus endoradicis]